MKLLIMRHGQTQANVEKRYAGITDVPLTKEGIAQAQNAYHNAAINLVYVSALQRAQITAKICFPNAQQIIVAGLNEMNFGKFQGKTYLEMSDDVDYREWVDGYCMGRCPGGETRAEHIKRVTAAVEWVFEDATKRELDKIVIVAHGGTIMGLFSACCVDDDRDYYDWLTENCGGYVADVNFDGTRLEIKNAKPISTDMQI